MFEQAKELLDGSLVASLDEVTDAVRILAGRARVVAEGAGATPVALARRGAAGTGKVVCIVSGGNIDASKLAEILGG
jgi:threonine dehydratase